MDAATHSFTVVDASLAVVIGTLLAGLLTGLGLIVAIGAQNAYVLRLGITGPARAVLVAVTICAVSDLLLILAGVLGIGVLVEKVPVALIVLRIVGAAFLIVYGIMAARRALRPQALTIETDSGGGSSVRGGVATATSVSLRTVALTTVAFTWLNPHVYLDTLLFLGSVANQQPGELRWVWAAGAMASSILWFFSLGFGARYLRPVFAKPAAWRVLDSIIAVVMIGLGLKLAIWG
ncbi:MAG: amino acid transporter [Microbacteriaceae bacterium]|nr:amino acid transporter [Microbacteriaceae bacterium]